MTGAKAAEALALLAEEVFSICSNTAQLLNLYCGLVREFNPVCGLVSRGDVEHLESRHVVDSLSLAPVLHRLGLAEGSLLDVGSGGGFPAIPLKIVLPSLEVTMVERSTKRAGFLRKAIGALKLQDARVVMGSFPRDVGHRSWDVVTARAVDKPAVVFGDIIESLPSGGVFLCQFGEPKLENADMFHVEHVEDEWTRRGLRRGDLHIIRRLPS